MILISKACLIEATFNLHLRNTIHCYTLSRINLFDHVIIFCSAIDIKIINSTNANQIGNDMVKLLYKSYP